MKFHERLKELRTERARTQKKLAQMMQVTDDCICFWGKGRSEPSIQQILDLCRLVRSRHRCFTWQNRLLKSAERSGNYFAIPPPFCKQTPPNGQGLRVSAISAVGIRAPFYKRLRRDNKDETISVCI